MFRLIVLVWHYTAAALTNLFNERADPRIQIDQAIAEARQQHRNVTDSAATVIANRLEVEMKIARKQQALRALEQKAGQALRLADQARASGDSGKTTRFERSAELYATEIAANEVALGDLEDIHGRAAVAAAAATRVVEQSKAQLQEQLIEKTRLLNDLAAAEMQKRIAAAMKAMDQFAPDGTIPTLPKMRERIDSLAATSGAQIAVALDDVAATKVDVERGIRERRGAEILDEIRQREGLPAVTNGGRA